MHGPLAFKALVALIVLVPLRAIGQVITRIPPAAACDRCEIELDALTTLGTAGGRAQLSRYSTVGRDGRGRWFVGMQYDDGPVARYQPDGRYSGPIGRSGKGPGEFSFVAALTADDHDSLHVFGTHYSVFDPDGKHARTLQVFEGARVYSAFSLPRRQTLVQATQNTADLAGVPLHVIDRTGKVLRSFGMMPNEPFKLNFWTRWRPVSLSGVSGAWIGTVNHYKVERWSLDGSRKLILERRAEWFPQWENWSGEMDVDKPPPRILSIHEDKEGLLWVLIMVADAKYKPIATRVGRRERRMYNVADEDSLNDTMLEVIDPKTGRLVTSQRFPQALLGIIDDDHVFGMGIDRDGDLEVRVWRMRLIRR